MKVKKNDPDRHPDGRFKGGNKLAANRADSLEVRLMREFRRRTLKSISEEDITQIMTALLNQAVNKSDVPAAKELLNRLVGPPVSIDVLDRVSRLEEEVEEMRNQIGTHESSHSGAGIQNQVAQLLASEKEGSKNDNGN